jgi:hypothetical protein
MSEPDALTTIIINTARECLVRDDLMGVQECLDALEQHVGHLRERMAELVGLVAS